MIRVKGGAAGLIAAGVAIAVTLMGGRGGDEPAPFTVQGTITGGGQPAAGVFVTARQPGSNVGITVYTDADGLYHFPALDGGAYEIEAHSPRLGHSILESGQVGEAGLDWSAELDGTADRFGPPAPWFSRLEEGEEKRRFIVDCTSCHVFNEDRLLKDDHPRTEEEWQGAIAMMLGQFGQGSGFPIISGHRDVQRDAAWLSEAFGQAPPPPEGYGSFAVEATNAVLTEYDVPVPQDLAHDLMVHPDGSVLVTGMFTHQMYILDPASGAWTTEAIPVQSANPRALDIADNGDWWILLGGPGAVAHKDIETGEWTTHGFGMYPHSVALDGRGGVWANGHFTVAPELIKRLDMATGEFTEFEVPPVAMGLEGESTIPYGLRAAEDGMIWATQLRGSHLIRLDPETGEMDLWETPTTYAGPRRPDVAPDGMIWVPMYGAGTLAKFDPETEAWTEYDLPIEDALPYVARVDQRRGTVWLGTGAADAVLSFDPATEEFTTYPLPTKGVLIRHIDVDEETGDLWAAYSASPGIPGKVLRIQLR